MVRTTANLDDVLGKSEFTRLKTVQPVALHDPTAQLILLSRAPGVNATLVIQGKNMIGSASQPFDLLQGRDQTRGGLDVRSRVKPEDSIVTLDSLANGFGQVFLFPSVASYSESSPSIDQTIIGQRKACTIGSGDFNKDSAFRESGSGDGGRSRLARVESAVFIV